MIQLKKLLKGFEIMDIIKDKKTAGADEKTPSLAQYFSWVNNTNEVILLQTIMLLQMLLILNMKVMEKYM